MLKVCVVVDVEGFISLRQANPMWGSWEKIKSKMNYLLRNLRYDKNSYYKMYDLVVKYKFPISFMLVGSSFKPLKKEGFIDFGYHSLNHKPLTLINDKELEKEVKNIFNAVSFSPPIWLIEDVKNPQRIFRALNKESYKITTYRGKVRGIIPEAKSIKKGIFKPIKKYGMKAVYVSNAFSGESITDIKKILREIKANCKKNAVYCVTTHDFSNKNTKNFEYLIKELIEMEKNKMIMIKNLREIAKNGK